MGIRTNERTYDTNLPTTAPNQDVRDILTPQLSATMTTTGMGDYKPEWKENDGVKGRKEAMKEWQNRRNANLLYKPLPTTAPSLGARGT